MRMSQWLIGNTFSDMIRNERICKKSEFTSIEKKMKENQLR